MYILSERVWTQYVTMKSSGWNGPVQTRFMSSTDGGGGSVGWGDTCAEHNAGVAKAISNAITVAFIT